MSRIFGMAPLGFEDNFSLSPSMSSLRRGRLSSWGKWIFLLDATRQKRSRNNIFEGSVCDDPKDSFFFLYDFYRAFHIFGQAKIRNGG